MSACRLTLTALLSLCASVVGLLSAGTPAQAAVIHEYLSQITEVPASSGAAVTGPFGKLNSMTVDSGELYIADGAATEPARAVLDKFNASSSSFVSQFPQVPPPLEFLDQGVAVGHSTGEPEVYVGGDELVEGSPQGVVAVFNAAGSLQAVWKGTPGGGFGCFECAGTGYVAVDNSTSLGWASGDVYVADPTRAVVDVFKPEAGGKEPSELAAQLTGPEPGVPFSQPTGVAVDPSSGNVLVVDGGGFINGPAVDIFRPAALPGQYELVEKLTETPGGPLERVRGVTVDGGNGDIYVSAPELGVIYQFSSTGVYLGRLTGTPAGAFNGMAGVAVDPASHLVYVGDHKGGAGVVDIFGRNLVIPDVTTGPASSVQPGSATLNGVVNPDGLQVTDCHFEYGITASYGQSVPCAQTPAQIGAGNSPVAVSADLSGLTPGVLYHYRLSASNANGINSALDDRLVGPPRISSEASTDVAQTTATLHAQVNPEGVDTTYSFEYGPSNTYGTSVPVPNGDLGSGERDQAIVAELSRLQAGVTYHYRVVAVNGAGTVMGVDQTFTTVPSVQIDSVTISDISATSATLHARINPLGTDTTYHFEYGTNSSYGASVPVPDEDIGSGTVDVTVTQKLTGLSPNLTYHLRVVADNVLGATRSSDHTFTYSAPAPGLPDGRAYEMVTPPAKNGALIGAVLLGVAPDVAANGSRVIAPAIQCFAESPSCTASRGNEGEPFSFSRTSGGWQTTALAPPPTQVDGNTVWLVSANTNTALFTFTVPSPSGGQEDFVVREADGSYVDMGPTSESGRGGGLLEGAKTGTEGFQHIAWEMGVSWSFAPSEQDTVYEWSGPGNAAPELVGVSGGHGSRSLISECATELGTAGTHHAMSTDGSVIAFIAVGHDRGGCRATTAPPVDELYARLNSSTTVAISRASSLDCTTSPCTKAPPSDGKFEDASADGTKVFFTDTQQLTDGASEDAHPGDTASHFVGTGCGATTGPNGCNLYEYDFGGPAGHNLVAVSAGDTSGLGPEVQRVLAVSADGSHVYFVAKGVLSASPNDQGTHPSAGGENLYVFERDASHPAGHTAFVGILTDTDQHESADSAPTPSVTPDGRFLVFTSHGDLTADDDSASGAAQVFRYDAQEERLVRISVGEHGFNDNGNTFQEGLCEDAGQTCPRDASIPPPTDVARRDPAMSDDGSYVFFRSPVGLTPQALNDVRVGISEHGAPHYAQNVYEYHNGHVSLISDGKDTSQLGGLSAVVLLGSDATGSNVFFSTSDQLLAQDTDTQGDYYDARICTPASPCIPPAAPPLPPCLGEQCHGTPAATPPGIAPPSATFSGSGNLLAPGGRAPNPAKPKTAAQIRAEKLAKALRVCRAKHDRRKRAACEAQARRRYGPKGKPHRKTKSKSRKGGK